MEKVKLNNKIIKYITYNLITILVYYLVIILLLGLLIKLLFNYPAVIEVKYFVADKLALGIFLGIFHWYVLLNKNTSRFYRLRVGLIIIFVTSLLYVLIRRLI